MIKKLIHFLFVICIWAIIIGIPCAWMIHRSYSDPEVHYFYTKESRQNDEETGAESLRFIVISDLYGYVFEGGNGIIADLVSNTFPDAILIGGNLINGEAEEITEITDLIKRLSQIAPVYYTYGEQERKYVTAHGGTVPDGTDLIDSVPEKETSDVLRDALEKAGAVVLCEEFTDVQLYGIDVRIGGMYGNAYELTNLRHEVKKNSESTWNLLSDFQDTGSLKIMMSIRPESFVFSDACDTWNIDLVVSGNLMGGLVVLPYYGGVFGGAQGNFPEFVHGLYEKSDSKIMITSGLSAPNGRIPRFNNPPEIAVLDIDGLSRAE